MQTVPGFGKKYARPFALKNGSELTLRGWARVVPKVTDFAPNSSRCLVESELYRHGLRSSVALMFNKLVFCLIAGFVLLATPQWGRAEIVPLRWQDVPWRSGQILGISSRSELIPVFVQLGTLSVIDHVGVVSVEDSQPWLYEFSIATGLQKIPLEKVREKYLDKHGQVHFVVGELHEALNSAEWQTVSQQLDVWVSGTDSVKPKNCLATVLGAFAKVNPLSVRFTSGPNWARTLYGGLIEKMARRVYPDFVDFPVIASVFDHLKIVAGNLSKDLVWPSEAAVFNEWEQSGDLSKFTRMLAFEMRMRLAPSAIVQQTNVFKSEILSAAGQGHLPVPVSVPVSCREGLVTGLALAQ